MKGEEKEEETITILQKLVLNLKEKGRKEKGMSNKTEQLNSA
jgi:hypothetical protein